MGFDERLLGRLPAAPSAQGPRPRQERALTLLVRFRELRARNLGCLLQDLEALRKLGYVDDE